MASVNNVSIHWVRTPLFEPYQLSYGPVEFLNSIFCRAELDDGRAGWGESTPLPGYCPSTADDVWATMERACEDSLGKEAAGIFSSAPEGDGFLTTALHTACEEAVLGAPTETGEVPLIGLIQGGTPDSLIAGLESARGKGYAEFKMKAGVYPPGHEAGLIREVQSCLHEGEWLRLDANQGLDLNSAKIVSGACDPARVRYLEQPLPELDWEGSAALAKSSPIPIALDEAITGLESLDRAARSRAGSYIKLKWMKQGSSAALKEMVERARQHGFQVIFGNGVATGWNGRQESVFWLRYLAADGFAGEMNGFLKVPGTVSGLSAQNGRAIVALPPPEAPGFATGNIIKSKTYGPRSG